MNKLREFVSFLKRIGRDEWFLAIQVAALTAAASRAIQESRKFNQEIQQLRKYMHEQNTQNGCGVENVR